MDANLQNALSPLLHAACLMFFPIIMGLSTALCLRSGPSPFSIVSVHEYVDSTKWLDHLWLLAILASVAQALSRSGGAFGAAASPGLTAAVAVLALLLVAAHFWFRSVLAAELAVAAKTVREAGELTTVSADGVCIAQRRERDSSVKFACADRGVKIYAAAGIGGLGVFAAAAIAASGQAQGPSIAQCIVLAGFYVSLGVIAVDLCEDVWPGFSDDQRLKRASRYYVQIFEEWKNQGVLAGFLTVLIGAPYVYARGEAPMAVMSFPIWIGSCLCFATYFNRVLFPRGMVTSTLPLPVWVNVYSVKYPLWAHFFAVIHLVMAITLVVGIAVLGI